MTKRRHLLEKHTLGWTPEDESQSEPTGKGKEPEPAGKENKKASRTKEPVEKGPVLQEPIKITMWRREQEPVDFVQKIRLGTTDEEADEELAETLERHAPKRSREQRAKELAPMVEGTQQRAKEPTPTVGLTQEREEPRAAQSEATTDRPDQGREQVLPDFGNEHVLPDLGIEQVLAPGLSPRQLVKQPDQQPEPPLSGSAQSTPTEEGEHGLKAAHANNG